METLKRQLEAEGNTGYVPLTSYLLCAACYHETEEIVTYLLSVGADANGRDTDGDAPLHVAVWGSGTRIQERLIAAGADVNARSRRGWTPLEYLFSCPTQFEHARVLLKAGATFDGRTHGANLMHPGSIIDHLLWRARILLILLQGQSGLRTKRRCSKRIRGLSPTYPARNFLVLLSVDLIRLLALWF